VDGLTAKATAHAGFPAVQPPAIQAMPRQEPGRRNLRATPYELFVEATQAPGELALQFVNAGRSAVVFHTYAGIAPTAVKRYTVDVRTDLADSFPLSTAAGYDLTVTGPNGFLRRFAGGAAGTDQEVAACYEVSVGDLYLDLVNSAHTECTFTISDHRYGQAPQIVRVGPLRTVQHDVCLSRSHGWYDVVVTSSADPTWVRRLAGHVETGAPSVSDPALSSAELAGPEATAHLDPAVLEKAHSPCPHHGHDGRDGHRGFPVQLRCAGDLYER
jgi:phospholipase C